MDEIQHNKGKIYYSMGEVCEMFDVNPSLIRFWEQKFDILKPHKNKKGNRLFTPADVDNLKLIYHLVKEKGMTLAGARKRIKDNPEGVKRDQEVVDRLLAIKSLLMEIRQELKSDADEIIRDPSEEEISAAVPNRKVNDEVPAPEGLYPSLGLEADEEDKTPASADQLLDVQAEKEWVEDEITETDEIDGDIHVLMEEAGLTAEEADILLESDEMVPLEGDITAPVTDAGMVDFGVDTDEGEPGPVSGFTAPAAAEGDLFTEQPAEEKPPRGIYEQTLF